MPDERSIDYRQLFDNAPIGIIYVRLDGSPVILNEQAARGFGYDSPEQFLAEVFSMLDLWVDLADRERAAEMMISEGVLRDFEVAMRRRDGSRVVLSLSANPWRDAEGNTVGLQVSGIEITARVDAERRLEEAQAHASIGFWSWRIDTRDFQRSDQTMLILGLDPHGPDPDAEGFMALVHPDDRDLLAMEVATNARRPDGHLEMEFRIVTPSGEERWLVVRASVDPDGQRLSGSVQDITKQKLVEEKLKELNDLKTEFVGVVAHDLRSPLTVAGGYTEFLKEQWDTFTESERRGLVDNVKRSLDKLTTLVANVLEVTKLQAATTGGDARSFDLGALVRSVIDDLASTAGDRRCAVVTRGPLPLAVADPGAAERVVTNLVSNALKYSPVDAPVEVFVDRWGSDLRVAVSDRGPGIAPEDQRKLFQRFSRLPSGAGAGPRPDGTGLGLFICRSLVEAWGGTIWVESVVGEGSTFAFTVPSAPEARAG